MIILYLHKECEICRGFLQKLEELALAHHAVNVPEDSSSRHPENVPRIADGDIVIIGHVEVKRYIEDLGEFASLWRKYQTDACYLDDEGNVC